jgi:hypothetical protein
MSRPEDNRGGSLIPEALPVLTPCVPVAISDPNSSRWLWHLPPLPAQCYTPGILWYLTVGLQVGAVEEIQYCACLGML